MADLDRPELRALVRVSQDIGRDIELVQGAGGNTSAKLDGVLWVKASGTWLADAGDDWIFVPVDLAVARQAITDGEENIPALPSPGIKQMGAKPMRPSIETSLHALMPHRFVLHVHGVNSIAWAALAAGEAGIARRLAGLRWSFVPYCRPGVPLSQAVAGLVERERPDILMLGNHGLVVGADDADQAFALAREVERRLDLAARRGGRADLDRLAALAADSAYRPAGSDESHWTALDGWSLTVAAKGSLYPDHVVFLGPGAYVLGDGETPVEVAARAQRRGVPLPAFMLVPGAGTLIRRDLTAGAEAALRCLGLVTARLPVDEAVRYLTAAEEGALLNWDAEHYRQSLARA